MVYLESVIIFRGQLACILFMASMTAAISPAWLDWSSPGTLMAWFWGLSGLNQTPHPQRALALPLL
jgi:hypothetical protein